VEQESFVGVIEDPCGGRSVNRLGVE
jgi:hypothetical protein